jgi:hypothetical protein
MKNIFLLLPLALMSGLSASAATVSAETQKLLYERFLAGTATTTISNQAGEDPIYGRSGSIQCKDFGATASPRYTCGAVNEKPMFDAGTAEDLFTNAGAGFMTMGVSDPQGASYSERSIGFDCQQTVIQIAGQTIPDTSYQCTFSDGFKAGDGQTGDGQ